MRATLLAIVLAAFAVVPLVAAGDDDTGAADDGATQSEPLGADPAAMQPEGSGSSLASEPVIPSAVLDDPAAVVREYLLLSSAGETSAAESLVDPRCRETMGDGLAALEIMGARIQAESVETVLVDIQPDSATVDFTARGSLHGDSLSAPLDVFGADVELHIDSLAIDDISVSDQLQLVRSTDRWLVSCP